MVKKTVSCVIVTASEPRERSHSVEMGSYKKSPVKSVTTAERSFNVAMARSAQSVMKTVNTT